MFKKKSFVRIVLENGQEIEIKIQDGHCVFNKDPFLLVLDVKNSTRYFLHKDKIYFIEEFLND